MAAQGSVAMSNLIWLSEAQMRWIEPYFPLSHCVPQVNDRLGTSWRGSSCKNSY